MLCILSGCGDTIGYLKPCMWHFIIAGVEYLCMHICWPSPSNQSFYRQIAGYRMGVGNDRVG